MTINKVAFIGLGVMGYPMAGYLAKNGYKVNVYNRTISKAEKWAKNFKGKIISVSRANVIDNAALLNNLDNITHAHVDTLDSKHREELLESGKVTYTKHTAWEHNFSFETNPYYYGDLHDILLHCLFDNVKDLDIKPVLNRTERVTF